MVMVQHFNTITRSCDIHMDSLIDCVTLGEIIHLRSSSQQSIVLTVKMNIRIYIAADQNVCDL